MAIISITQRDNLLQSLEGKINAKYQYIPERDAVRFTREIPMDELLKDPEEPLRIPFIASSSKIPWIPWFDNVKEAENFCMGPIGDENRLIDKAKKDFIRRSAKIRKSELRLWMQKEGEK